MLKNGLSGLTTTNYNTFASNFGNMYEHWNGSAWTTESSPDRKIQGKQAGATGWMVKPFNPDQLLATLERVLGNQTAVRSS